MSEFVTPRTLGQALEAMDRPGAKPLAGGTDLMIALRKAVRAGETPPELIVDLSRVPEMQEFLPEAKEPYLGAGLTFRFLENDPVTASVFPLLARAAATVGSVQVRQTATIGGNVANSSPAADGMSALCALGARAEIVSSGGTRFCPIGELITAPGKNTLLPNEIIKGFLLDKLPPKTGQVFAKVGRRQAVSIARLNVAVCLDENLEDPRVVLGACFPTPRRLTDVELLIKEGKPADALWQKAGKAAGAHFVDVCGWRSSATYKVPAIGRMMSRALADAWRILGGAA